MSGLM